MIEWVEEFAREFVAAIGKAIVGSLTAALMLVMLPFGLIAQMFHSARGSKS